MSYANRFGHFYTLTFSDNFPSVEDFITEYRASALGAEGGVNSLSNSTLTMLYYLLYARYGNSHTIFTDNNQFKYNVFSIIFMYGPTWERRISLQEKIRKLTDEEITEGSMAKHTHADNPGVRSANAYDQIDYIDAENTTKYKKSKIEGLALAGELLDTDVTREFINRFSKLFIKIIAPYAPLYYETDIEEGDED